MRRLRLQLLSAQGRVVKVYVSLMFVVLSVGCNVYPNTSTHVISGKSTVKKVITFEMDTTAGISLNDEIVFSGKMSEIDLAKPVKYISKDSGLVTECSRTKHGWYKESLDCTIDVEKNAEVSVSFFRYGYLITLGAVRQSINVGSSK